MPDFLQLPSLRTLNVQDLGDHYVVEADDRFLLLSRKHNLDNKGLEKLDEWSTAFPELGAAYAAKEAFHDIYSHKCNYQVDLYGSGKGRGSVIHS